MHAPRRPLTSGLLAALLAACTPPAAVGPPTPDAAADPCRVGDASEATPQTIRVALLDEVAASRAPTPVTDADHLVFRQLYEQLVRVDCTGAVRPGLAGRWRSDDSGRRWTFALRPGAAFWDGTPVDAAAMLAAWRADSTLPLADLRQADDSTVVVVLAAPRPVTAFADPAWSVVKRIAESAWPLGTGAVWVAEWTTAGDDSLLQAIPVPHARAGTPTLEFRRSRATDPRDLIDRDLDVLVTRDPAVRRYAEGRAGWTAVPLTWDRVYGLVSPTRARAASVTQLDEASRTALAHDAVRADARAPESDAWWEEPACTSAGPGALVASPLRRVAFPREDPVARDLADRLVARADAELTALTGLSAAGTRSVALDPRTWAATLRSGTEFALVLPLPRRPLDRCRAVGMLVARAPWLSGPDGRVPATAVVPLVETRASALLRRGIGAELDGEGGIRLVPTTEARVP